MESPDIVFSNSEIYDFVGCMERISLNDAYSSNMNEPNHMLHVDENIANWVSDTIESFNPEMIEYFKFFFDREISFGVGMLKIAYNMNISSIDMLIKILIDMNCHEMIMYFINNDDNFITKEDIDRIRNSQSFAYKYINETFPVSTENKWRILTLINEPETCKQKFVRFIQEFYSNYYIGIREKAADFVKCESPKIINYLIEDPVTRIKMLALIDIKEGSRLKLVIGFSYFIDLGVSIVDDSNLNISIVTMGTRRLERLRILGADYLTDEQMIDICNVLSDRTRIGILKMLRDGPVYGSQIAEKFGISNPAASYHLEQFMVNGLVRVQKEGHRLYYYLKADRIEQVINYLKDFAIPAVDGPTKNE